jgi:hypothetical protein
VGPPPSLTAEFPDEPERKPEVSMDFEAASFTNEQATQDERRVQDLQSQRDAPHVQGMDYTIGGSIEQEVHETVANDREMEIQSLQARIQRQKKRSRSL